MTTDLMDPIEWLEQAKAVPVGQKEKVTHLCGDASLVVYNNIDSWTAWCWRCHTRGWVPKEQPNMKERLARKAQQEAIDRELSYQVRPPSPASFDLTSWSVAARVWLYKAGLTPDKIRDLGAYFHEPTQRVVLPIRDSDGKVVFWQARNPEFPKVAGAKYISASVPRHLVHVLYGDSYGEAGAVAHSRKPYVLTEDILSAFKVGASGAGIGYAVMGTALGPHTVARLLQSGVTDVLLWFDPDSAGEAARQTISKQLRLVGIDATSITTDRDPKCYSFDEIRGYIDGIRSHAVADNAGAEEVLSTQADT